MNRRFMASLPKWVIPGVAGALLISFAAVYFFLTRDRHAPPAIVVSACRDVAPGVHRIAASYGTHFDVSEKAFAVHSGVQDMPPGRVFIISSRDTTAKIMIVPNDDSWRALKNNLPAFSRPVKERNVRTGKESSFGVDHWGYLKSGERWRYVAFSGGDAAGYPPTPLNETVFLDQVISSACFLPVQNSPN